MHLIDSHKFEKAGFQGCSNSAYNLLKTSCCKKYCVEDIETLNLFIDPGDPAAVKRLYEEFPCPFCNEKKYNLTPIQDIDSVTEHCEWKWALVDS